MSCQDALTYVILCLQYIITREFYDISKYAWYICCCEMFVYSRLRERNCHVLRHSWSDVTGHQPSVIQFTHNYSLFHVLKVPKPKKKRCLPYIHSSWLFNMKSFNWAYYSHMEHAQILYKSDMVLQIKGSSAKTT